jgi:hypothetical protein
MVAAWLVGRCAMSRFCSGEISRAKNAMAFGPTKTLEEPISRLSLRGEGNLVRRRAFDSRLLRATTVK